MKNMRKGKIVMLVIALSFSLFGELQARNDMDMLMEPKCWYFTKKLGVNFTRDSIIYIYKDNTGCRVLGRRLYYLSDEIDSVFNNTKVGKNKNGKYMIIEDPKRNRSVLKNIKITESERIVETLGNPPQKIRYVTCPNDVFKNK